MLTLIILAGLSSACMLGYFIGFSIGRGHD